MASGDLRGEKGLWKNMPFYTKRVRRGEGSAVQMCGSLAADLLAAVAVAVHLLDLDLMGNPVERGAGADRIARVATVRFR
jgi:hypothetical protein